MIGAIKELRTVAYWYHMVQHRGRRQLIALGTVDAQRMRGQVSTTYPTPEGRIIQGRAFAVRLILPLDGRGFPRAPGWVSGGQ